MKELQRDPDEDDDVRAALVRAHEPAPAFAATLTRHPRRLMPYVLAVAGVVAAAVVAVVVWRTTPEAEPTMADAPPQAAVAVDLQAPAMRQTSLAMPTDSLLRVPGLDALGTTPSLVSGGLP